MQERNQLFRNIDGTTFDDLTEVAGELCSLEITRGPPLAISTMMAIPIFLLETTRTCSTLHQRIRFTSTLDCVLLQNQSSNTPQLQCQVNLELADGRKLTRTPRTDGSYLSVNDPRVLFGLGASAEPITLTVHWHDGTRESFIEIIPNQYVTLKQGNGKALSAGETKEPTE